MTGSERLVRPRFARTSAVIFLLLVPFVMHAVWDYIEARRLRTRIDAIAARGEPLTFRETKVAHLTSGAAESERYYRASAALLSPVYEGIPSTTGYRIRTAERDGVWPPDLVAVIRDAVDRNADALALVDRAALLPFEGFSPGTSYNYQMSELLALVRLCDWRAVLRAAEGNLEGAVDSLYSEARLARALGSPPHAATALVGSFPAIPFVLERGRPSASARKRLDDALAALDREDNLQQQFLLSRAMLIDEHLQGERRAARVAWTSPVQTWRRHRVVQTLDDYEPVLRAAERPWPEPLQALPALADPNRTPRRYDRSFLAGSAKMWARFAQVIRCARLRVSDGSLELLDPYTGRLLELVSCKL
jgi:hypothetical protein